MSLNALVADVRAVQQARHNPAVSVASQSPELSSEPRSRPKPAARRMGMSDATFWRKVKEGKIKVTKISERITLVAESEIQAVLAGERA